MLNRYSIRMYRGPAILFSAVRSNNARGFENGDLITNPQTIWGDGPTPTNPAGLLALNYNAAGLTLGNLGSPFGDLVLTNFIPLTSPTE